MQVWVNRELNGRADTYDYDIKKHDRTVTIYLSNNSEWTNPGSYAGGILDNEEGIVIELDDIEIELDYFQAEKLMALMLAIYDGHMELRESTIIRGI